MSIFTGRSGPFGLKSGGSSRRRPLVIGFGLLEQIDALLDRAEGEFLVKLALSDALAHGLECT